jgi:tRNA (guanine37-N1)-methyltransferase
MKKIPQDIVGDIAILKFPRRTLWITKKIKSLIFLKKHKGLKTILEKVEGFSGELRTLKTNHLAGLRTKEAIYKENDCLFTFNIDEAYFSPRLSNERKVISEEFVKIAKKNRTNILVMFAGVCPYPIIIAKELIKKKKEFHIISNELNEKANIYGNKNIHLNKLNKKISIIKGNAKDLPKKLKKKFDIILMPRPNIKDTFLKVALKLSKKGTVIFYHGFGTEKEVLEEIKKETKGKIGKISIRKAGDIGPYKYRWQAVFKVK